jgi:hypothetical protein
MSFATSETHRHSGMAALAGVGCCGGVLYTKMKRSALRPSQLADLFDKPHSSDIFDSHHALHTAPSRQAITGNKSNRKLLIEFLIQPFRLSCVAV